LHLWWPLLLCKAIAMGFTLSHKVSLQTSKAIILPKTRASRYSHHLNQSALCETNWFFRTSGCNLYLNHYLIIYTGHHHEISTRDSWNYVYLTPDSCSSHHNHNFYLKHYNFMSMLNQPTHPYFISCQTQHITTPFHPIKHMQHHTSSFYNKSFNHATQTPKTQKRIALEHVPDQFHSS